MRLDETTGDRETETCPAGDDGQRNVIDTVPGQSATRHCGRSGS